MIDNLFYICYSIQRRAILLTAADGGLETENIMLAYNLRNLNNLDRFLSNTRFKNDSQAFLGQVSKKDVFEYDEHLFFTNRLFGSVEGAEFCRKNKMAGNLGAWPLDEDTFFHIFRK